MNSLIIQDYDKFREKLTLSTIKTKDIAEEINFRYISTYIVMDYHKDFLEGDQYLEDGEAIIRINDSKNYTLKAHRNYRMHERHDFSYEESVYYDISRELLKEIADASKVELLITGHNVYDKFHYHRSLYDEATVPIQVSAQALWDAIYNSSEYSKNINDALQYIEDCKKYGSCYGRSDGIWGWGIGLTIIVGGIWSLFVVSWSPMIWFAIGTVALGTLNLIKRKVLDSKIKDYESKYGVEEL